MLIDVLKGSIKMISVFIFFNVISLFMSRYILQSYGFIFFTDYILFTWAINLILMISNFGLEDSLLVNVGTNKRQISEVFIPYLLLKQIIILLGSLIVSIYLFFYNGYNLSYLVLIVISTHIVSIIYSISASYRAIDHGVSALFFYNLWILFYFILIFLDIVNSRIFLPNILILSQLISIFFMFVYIKINYPNYIFSLNSLKIKDLKNKILDFIAQRHTLPFALSTLFTGILFYNDILIFSKISDQYLVIVGLVYSLTFAIANVLIIPIPYLFVPKYIKEKDKIFSKKVSNLLVIVLFLLLIISMLIFYIMKVFIMIFYQITWIGKIYDTILWITIAGLFITFLLSYIFGSVLIILEKYWSNTKSQLGGVCIFIILIVSIQLKFGKLEFIPTLISLNVARWSYIIILILYYFKYKLLNLKSKSPKTKNN